MNRSIIIKYFNLSTGQCIRKKKSYEPNYTGYTEYIATVPLMFPSTESNKLIEFYFVSYDVEEIERLNLKIYNIYGNVVEAD